MTVVIMNILIINRLHQSPIILTFSVGILRKCILEKEIRTEIDDH